MNQTLNGSVMNTVVSVGMTRMNAEGGGQDYAMAALPPWVVRGGQTVKLTSNIQLMEWCLDTGRPALSHYHLPYTRHTRHAITVERKTPSSIKKPAGGLTSRHV